MYFLFIGVMSIIVLASAEQTYVDMPPEAAALMAEKSIACVEEAGVNSDIFHRFLQWQFGDDESSKKFYFCLFKNIGLSDDSGHFHVDQVLTLFKNSARKDEVLSVAEECSKLQENTPLNTMYASLLCFARKSPELVQVKTD